MLMKSSTPERVGVHHVAHHLGDPVEHVVAGVGLELGGSPHGADGHGSSSGARQYPSRASAGTEPAASSKAPSSSLVELAQAALLQAGQPHRADLGAGQPADGWPTWSSSRRTIRLRPSWMTSSTIERSPWVERTFAALHLHRPVLERRPRRSSCWRVALRDHAVDLGDVGLVHLVRRVRHPVGEVAVVGQQDQAVGVGVEPADVEEPLGPVGDVVA